MKKVFIVITVLILLFSFSACKGGSQGGLYIPSPPPTSDPPEIKSNVFTYNYNEATGGNTVENVEITPEEILQTMLTVPNRDGYEFDGWFSDWYFRTRVSDAQGEIVVGDELFENKSRDLYAKWRDEDAPVFPILMVFVTEVDAVLEKLDGTKVEVKYSMTADERKACEILVPMFEDYLNAMLNGQVSFKVDTFFTTRVVGSKSFTGGLGTGLGSTEIDVEYTIDAYNLPELGGMEWPEDNGLPPVSEIEGNGVLSKYRSVITTYGMNDPDSVLHIAAGSSSRKYASIPIESLFSSLIKQGGTVDYLFNFELENVAAWWESYMQLYLHEFAHSVELYLENKEVNPIDFHDAYRHYLLNKPNEGQSGSYAIEFIRKYLLYEADVNGIHLGIPLSFWLS